MAAHPFISGALEGFYGRPWRQDQRLNYSSGWKTGKA